MVTVNSFQAGPGTIEHNPVDQRKFVHDYVCVDCSAPVRVNLTTLTFFHDLGEQYRQIETEAREVKPAVKC